MNVKLLLFSVARDLAEFDAIDLDMDESARAGDVYDYLAACNEKFIDCRRHFRLAVNNEYVNADHALHGGDEVAVIPPVSGG
jgi:molybdopterin converting factor subunit 1